MAQPLKFKTYVLIINKATQIGKNKKAPTTKIGPYKIIDTPIANSSANSMLRIHPNKP